MRGEVGRSPCSPRRLPLLPCVRLDPPAAVQRRPTTFTLSSDETVLTWVGYGARGERGVNVKSGVKKVSASSRLVREDVEWRGCFERSPACVAYARGRPAEGCKCPRAARSSFGWSGPAHPLLGVPGATLRVDHDGFVVSAYRLECRFTRTCRGGTVPTV